ncbi:MAG: preprotein translocase subunit SecE [Chloroflexi bacterium]|nr:preprotein translocase subunit SecE [Chloroflexota bacterium]
MRRPISIPKGASLLPFRYFRDVWGELKRVVWPTREDTWRLTIMVIVLSVIVGAILAAFDVGFAELIDRVFLNR